MSLGKLSQSPWEVPKWARGITVRGHVTNGELLAQNNLQRSAQLLNQLSLISARSVCAFIVVIRNGATTTTADGCF